MVSFLLLHIKRVTCAFLNRYLLLVNLSSGFVVIPFVLQPWSSKVSLFKTLFIVPTDANYYRNHRMLKQFKIITLAPTCFGSRTNHHQGAVLCLAKTTKYGFFCACRYRRSQCYGGTTGWYALKVCISWNNKKCFNAIDIWCKHEECLLFNLLQFRLTVKPRLALRRKKMHKTLH